MICSIFKRWRLRRICRDYGGSRESIVARVWQCGGVALLLSLAIVRGVLADAIPSEVSVAAAQQPSATELALNYRQAVESMTQAWQRAHRAMLEGDAAAAREWIRSVVRERDRSGFTDLSDQALITLSQAVEEANRGNDHAAALLLEAAETLAPTDGIVTLKAAPIRHRLLGSGHWTGILAGVGELLRDPFQMVALAVGAIYPVLWAVTAAVYLVAVFALAQSVLKLSRRGAIGENRRRLIVVLCVAFAAAAVGPVYGAGLIACVLLGTRQRLHAPLVLCTGIMFILWGVAVPLREQLATWSRDSEIQALVRRAQGQFRMGEESAIERCNTQSKLYPEDSLIPLLCARILRVEGKLEAAERSAEQALIRSGNSPDARYEAGLVSLARGEYEEALDHLHAINLRGARASAVAFALSKALFERGETTASEQALADAIAENPDAVRRWQERESDLGIRHPAAFPRTPYQVSEILASALHPRMGVNASVEAKVAILTPGFDARGLSLAGMVLAVFALIAGRSLAQGPHQRGDSNLRMFHLLLPAWDLVWRGRDTVAIAILSLGILFILPVVRWPADVAVLTALVPEVVVTFGFLALAWYGALMTAVWRGERGT